MECVDLMLRVKGELDFFEAKASFWEKSGQECTDDSRRGSSRLDPLQHEMEQEDGLVINVRLGSHLILGSYFERLG